ncbi:MAG: hypothetical protein COW42_16980, partial [Deltaproteobacteria bacterium CG17_big_fil_post_rev_8_21_14_2_50_63_7]
MIAALALGCSRPSCSRTGIATSRSAASTVGGKSTAPAPGCDHSLSPTAADPILRPLEVGRHQACDKKRLEKTYETGVALSPRHQHETYGAVSAGHPEVAEVGAEILGRGGNAVDAAIAAFFTAFHAEPMLSSVGGGGFLVARVDGELSSYDFFAAAPGLGASEGPYKPGPGAFWGLEVDFGAATQTFHVGPGSIAVPGALAGLCTAHRDYG